MGFAGSAFAEEPLSFNQCIELTKQNNLEVRAAENSLQANLFLVDSSRGSYFPQVTGSLSYSQAGPQSVLGSAASTASYGAALGVTQNVFNGFADIGKVHQYEAQAKVSMANLETVKAKVSYDLKASIANFLYAKEIEKAAKVFLKRREDNLRMVELRFASGRENKGSLLLAQAYLKQAKSDVLKARNSRSTSLADFKKVLGLNEIDVVDGPEIDVLDEIPLNIPPENEPDFKKLAMATPDRKQYLAQVESSQASFQISKAGFLPALNFTGSVGKTDSTFFPNQDHWSVGAQFSWSLFGGGKDYYSVKSYASNLYAAQSKLTNTERQMLVSLKKAYTSYIESVEDFKVSEAFWQAAKSRAEIAQAKYNNGLLTFDEWDIIENDLISKTKVYIQSRRDRIIAEAAWDQIKGVGVIP